MNRKRHSFLFFILWGLLFPIFTPTDSFCQTSRDSLDTILNQIRTSDNELVLTEGIDYLKNRLDLIEDVIPPYYQIYVFEVMANGYHKLGDIEESETFAVKCLTRIKADPNSEYTGTRVRVLCLLGVIQRDKGLFNLAEKQYQKALALSPTASDSLYILNNYANLFKEQKKYDKAAKTYQEGIELLPRLEKDTLYQKTKLLDNLGNTLSIAKGEGLSELINALQLSRMLGNKIRSYSVNRHLTQHYLRKADTTAALQYAPTVYELSKEIGDKEYEKEALSLLLKLNQEQYGLRYVQLSDSLNTIRQNNDNAYALLKYDKSEAEKEALTAKVARQQTLIIGIIVVFSILLVAFISIAKVRKKRRRAILETEQRIAKHVHDDVANNIFLVMNKLENTGSTIILDDLSMIYEQARFISRSNSAFDTSQPYQQVLLDLFQQYSKEGFKITPQNLSKVSWRKISITKKEALYKVLQELLTNTLKHSEATFVVVGFQQERSTLYINYRDNGKGWSNKPSGGLLIAENRIRAASGTITFESSPSNGFRAKIKI